MDLIVVGLGALGAATLRAATRAGARCVGIDARTPGHAEGSSHGGSRIIRRALFEHPDYVRIVARAYELWAELEATSARHVFDEGAGLLLGGPPDGHLLSGTRRASSEHGLSIESLDRADVAGRWPEFLVPESFGLLWDPDGGILRPEEAVRAQVDGAVSLGAGLRSGEEVLGWRRSGGRLVVETASGRLEAGLLALCPGAWSRDLLRLDAPLQLLRKVLLWHRSDDPGWRLGSAPVFAFESGASLLYGFPALDERGVKIADHGGGHPVELPAEDFAAGDEDDRIALLRARFLRGLRLEPSERATCLYTNTSDGHAVLGAHPEEPGVFVAGGFSGHGFKHSIALGEALAQLALEGRSSLPLGLFEPGRFS